MDRHQAVTRVSGYPEGCCSGVCACGRCVPTGHHVTSVPLQRGTEFVAFNPRYNKLLALAEPVFIPTSSSSYRSGKDKDTSLSSYVSLVQLK